MPSNSNLLSEYFNDISQNVTVLTKTRLPDSITIWRATLKIF
jgi:hypothetical protein